MLCTIMSRRCFFVLYQKQFLFAKMTKCVYFIRYPSEHFQDGIIMINDYQNTFGQYDKH